MNILFTLNFFFLKACREPYVGSLVEKMDGTRSPEPGLSRLSCLDEIGPKSRSTWPCSGGVHFFSLATVNLVVWGLFSFGWTFLKISWATLYKIEKKMKIDDLSFIFLYGLTA